MKILHIAPHMGGGVGTVIMGWMDKVIAANDHEQIVLSLDTLNDKAMAWANERGFPKISSSRISLVALTIRTDIVLVHYWNHPMLKELLSHPLPPCRLVFWCHKNILYTQEELNYPDLWVDTSPIQGHGKYIWSTGDMSRFLEIKPRPHEGFNIGYVGTVDYKKLHPAFPEMCGKIAAAIPDARFTIVGDVNIPAFDIAPGGRVTFTGKVDDVAPYLAEMDVFGYPLRPDHYGTCEQALGEAMSAGVVPVVMDNPAEKIICNGATQPDIEKYVWAVEMFYNYPQLRKDLSPLVRERAKELYSIDTMISQWNEVFDKMMEKPKTAKEGK